MAYFGTSTARSRALWAALLGCLTLSALFALLWATITRTQCRNQAEEEGCTFTKSELWTVVERGCLGDITQCRLGEAFLFAAFPLFIISIVPLFAMCACNTPPGGQRGRVMCRGKMQVLDVFEPRDIEAQQLVDQTQGRVYKVPRLLNEEPASEPLELLPTNGGWAFAQPARSDRRSGEILTPMSQQSAEATGKGAKWRQCDIYAM